MATNSLWAQLNAGDMIASCGPEIAEVLNQVDLLVAKKRDEWDEQLREAVKRAEQEQKHIHQEKIHHLRGDLIKLKEAYIKLEHHHAKRPEKYKKLADERRVRLERVEAELAAERARKAKVDDENDSLRRRLAVAQADKELEVIKNIHLAKESEESAIVRNENDNLKDELNRLRNKYEELKRNSQRMSDDMKHEREGIIDSLVRLRTLESQQAEMIDSPRSLESSSHHKGPPLSPRSQQSQLLVLPLPVLDLNGTNSSTSSTENKENEIRVDIKIDKSGDESRDDALIAQMHRRIADRIGQFNAYVANL